MTDYSFCLERDLMIVLGTGRRNVACTPIATCRGGSVSHVILGLKIRTPMFSSQLFFNWKFSNLQKSWRTSTVNTCIPLIFSLIHKLLAFVPFVCPPPFLSLYTYTRTHISLLLNHLKVSLRYHDTLSLIFTADASAAFPHDMDILLHNYKTITVIKRFNINTILSCLRKLIFIQ